MTRTDAKELKKKLVDLTKNSMLFSNIKLKDGAQIATNEDIVVLGMCKVLSKIIDNDFFCINNALCTNNLRIKITVSVKKFSKTKIFLKLKILISI